MTYLLRDLFLATLIAPFALWLGLGTAFGADGVALGIAASPPGFGLDGIAEAPVTHPIQGLSRAPGSPGGTGFVAAPGGTLSFTYHRWDLTGSGGLRTPDKETADLSFSNDHSETADGFTAGEDLDPEVLIVPIMAIGMTVGHFDAAGSGQHRGEYGDGVPAGSARAIRADASRPTHPRDQLLYGINLIALFRF